MDNCLHKVLIRTGTAVLLVLGISIGTTVETVESREDHSENARRYLERVERYLLSERKDDESSTHDLIKLGKERQIIYKRKKVAMLFEAYRAACVTLCGEKYASEHISGFRQDNLTSVDKLLIADVYALTGSYEPALVLYDEVGRSSSELERAFAAEGVSDVNRRYHRLGKSLQWVNLAIKVLSHYKNYDKSQFKHQEYYNSLVAKRKELEDLLLIMKHGIGFFLYKQGRDGLKHGNNKRSIEKFDELLKKADENRGNNFQEIIARFKSDSDVGEELLQTLPVRPVYEEAAKFYRSVALTKIGGNKEAVISVSRFIKEQPLGLYRGEAHKLLAQIAMDVEQNPKRAISHYTDVVTWVADVRDLDKNLAQYEVPSASRQLTAPPEVWKKRDGWGNIVYERPDTEDVVNRLTAPWYLDAMLVDVYLKRSICYFLLDDTELAVADLEKMHVLDKQDQLMTETLGFSNYNRLRDGYRRGRLYATKKELQSFPMEVRIPLVMAELYFETEQWDKAIPAYRELIKEYENSLRTDPLSYLYYALASAYLYSGQRSKAEPILRKSFTNEQGRFYRALSWSRAMFAMANVDQKEDPFRWLWLGYHASNDKDIKIEFLLSIGQYYYIENSIESDMKAEKVFRRLLKESTDDDPRCLSARQYIAGIKQRSKDNNLIHRETP